MFQGNRALPEVLEGIARPFESLKGLATLAHFHPLVWGRKPPCPIPLKIACWGNSLTLALSRGREREPYRTEGSDSSSFGVGAQAPMPDCLESERRIRSEEDNKRRANSSEGTSELVVFLERANNRWYVAGAIPSKSGN